MKKELDEQLCKDFPLLYVDRNASMQQTCMCWGFPGSGWHQIIRDLSEKLEALITEWLKTNPHICANCGCLNEQHTYVSCKTIHRLPFRISLSKKHSCEVPTGRIYKTRWQYIKAHFSYQTTKARWFLQRKINTFFNTLFDKWNIGYNSPCMCEKFKLFHPKAVQVKEKFGRLRFYMNSKTKEMSELIMKAEDLSSATCEVCGNPGKERDGSWIRTLCDKCKKNNIKIY